MLYLDALQGAGVALLQAGGFWCRGERATSLRGRWRREGSGGSGAVRSGSVGVCGWAGGCCRPGAAVLVPPRPRPCIAKALCQRRLLRRRFVFLLSLACLPALKMTIKEVKKENGDKMIVPRKRKALKLGPIRKKNLKKLVLFLKNGADCPCHQLDNLGHYFLIMGRQVKTQYLLTAIYKWDKKNKEFKKFMKKMKSPDCPTFPSVFK